MADRARLTEIEARPFLTAQSDTIAELCRIARRALDERDALREQVSTLTRERDAVVVAAREVTR